MTAYFLGIIVMVKTTAPANHDDKQGFKLTSDNDFHHASHSSKYLYICTVITEINE